MEVQIWLEKVKKTHGQLRGIYIKVSILYQHCKEKPFVHGSLVRVSILTHCHSEAPVSPAVVDVDLLGFYPSLSRDGAVVSE